MESALARSTESAAPVAARPWQRCFWNSSWLRSSTSLPAASSPASAIRQAVAAKAIKIAQAEPAKKKGKK